MNAGILSRYGLITALLILCSATFNAQTKEELQKERDKIAKNIEYTKELLNKSKTSEKNTSTQLQLLEKQIQFRKQLIRSINGEITNITREIENSNIEIEEKEKYLEALKEEYAEMIYQSYKNRSSYDKIMYVFASESFEQAYKRLKTLQSYTESRQNQTNEIQQAQNELRSNIDELEKIKNDKESLLGSKKEENDNLLSDKSEKDKFLGEVRKEQIELDKKIKNQIAERERINKAIRKIVEIEASKGAGLALTPEGKIVSSNFEKNKGALPWPINRGIVTEGFGKQPHKTLAGIVTENNGIDITTDENSDVFAIFDGKVTSVFDIPGAGRNVIITHGAYKSIYSNLKDLSIKKGDTVAARQKIGTVLTAGSNTILHFEIWKISSAGSDPINPEYWISK